MLESSCNAGCQCDGVAYNPVCGADNVLYYSPCHAGCTKEVMLDSARVYSDCSCVNAYNTVPLESPLERRRRRYTTPGEDPEEDGEAGAFLDRSSSDGVEYDAINEPCTSSCDLLWVFIALAFITMLFTFLITMPALTATLRCVQDEQRSFALGIQWIKVRLLGTIPAPMIFGLLIDETCVLWRKDACDGGGGSCIAYDNLSMSRSVTVPEQEKSEPNFNPFYEKRCELVALVAQVHAGPRLRRQAVLAAVLHPGLAAVQAPLRLARQLSGEAGGGRPGCPGGQPRRQRGGCGHADYGGRGGRVGVVPRHFELNAVIAAKFLASLRLFAEDVIIVRDREAYFISVKIFDSGIQHRHLAPVLLETG